MCDRGLPIGELLTDALHLTRLPSAFPEMAVVQGEAANPASLNLRANKSVPGSLVTANPPVMITHPPLVPG